MLCDILYKPNKKINLTQLFVPVGYVVAQLVDALCC